MHFASLKVMAHAACPLESDVVVIALALASMSSSVEVLTAVPE